MPSFLRKNCMGKYSNMNVFTKIILNWNFRAKITSTKGYFNNNSRARQKGTPS